MAISRKRFVIHEHHARNLHFDLRLEIDGVLKSWAIPKGPSMNPNKKRLAIAVPDHPLSYIGFEGRLPEGRYGAGEVRVWDSGEYETPEDPQKRLSTGRLGLTFYGKKLKGEFAVVKMTALKKSWLLIKVDDHLADRNWQLETVL